MPRIFSAKDGNPPRKASQLYGEWGGLIGLSGLTIFFILTSWRRWADPLVDFGVQLYAPWRIVHGVLLYRDIDYLYGPFSPYFNAALFACFGTSLMVLVAANLLIFTGILASTYGLCRFAWGAGSALAALAVFISVFAFSQYVVTGNYNYATPYSHESTHGLLVCLLLALVLVRWVEQATPGLSLSAGFLFGLTFVLKPEILAAGALSLLVAALAAYRFRTFPPARAWAILFLAAILPTAVFVLYFSLFLPGGAALDAAGRAWTSVITTTRYIGNSQQQGFLGFDQLVKHFEEHVLGTLDAGLIFGFIAAVAWQVERWAHRWWHYLSIVVMAGLVLGLSIHAIHWIACGRCLTGLAGLYFATCLTGLFWTESPGGNRRAQVTRLLMAALAVAFLARMVLNARIYQFGYYQAVLAAIMVPAVLLGELPRWLDVGKKGTLVIALGTLCLFVPGVVILSGTSQQILATKTVVVGAGENLLYAFPANIDPTGDLVNRVNDVLRDARPGQTLLVLPQGLMINFLTRLPGPSAPCGYFHTESQEREIVAQLEANPPDFVVIISQDLRAFGIRRFGEKPNAGQQILNWVDRNYTRISAVGGDPLDPLQHGAIVLRQAHPNEGK